MTAARDTHFPTLAERGCPELRAEARALAHEGFRTVADIQRDFFAETKRQYMAVGDGDALAA